MCRDYYRTDNIKRLDRCDALIIVHRVNNIICETLRLLATFCLSVGSVPALLCPTP